MSLIIPANSAAASGGYQVDNSVRLNDGSSDSFNLTFGTPTNNLIWSFSTWIKRSTVTTTQNIFSARTDGSNFGMISINEYGYLDVASYIGGFEMRYITSRKFRDVSAFYHLCITNNSSLASPETKIYVNGVLETSFGTSNAASENEESYINKSGIAHWIGQNGNNQSYVDGYLAETVFLDGTVAAVTDFGEFDEDSGIWKPIDVSGLTFGNNGFYLNYKDSSALGADVSGESNNFTVNNLTAIDQTTDTCTNNFCLINPLDKYIGGTLATYSEGNTRFSSSGNSSSNNGTRCNFAVANGKWYWEVKLIQNAFRFGIQDVDATTQYNSGSNFNIVGTYAVQNNGAKSINNTESASAVTTFSNGDTAMMAMDLENQKLYFGVNGTWSNSGNPESGSSGTGSIGDLVDGTTYIPVFSNGAWAQNTIADFNFGNPAYAISSSNTDGNGYGNFEYAPPSGYLSLCTANLSEVLG